MVVNAEVILKVVRPETSNNKEASVKLNIKSGELFANKVADTFEEAVMQNIDALEKQLLKVKEKMQAK
jgi:putative sigma-54 modulation protein